MQDWVSGNVKLEVADMTEELKERSDNRIQL